MFESSPIASVIAAITVSVTRCLRNSASFAGERSNSAGESSMRLMIVPSEKPASTSLMIESLLSVGVFPASLLRRRLLLAVAGCALLRCQWLCFRPGWNCLTATARFPFAEPPEPKISTPPSGLTDLHFRRGSSRYFGERRHRRRDHRRCKVPFILRDHRRDDVVADAAVL